jgi:hypothetical protein
MDETVDGFSEHDAIFMKGALEQVSSLWHIVIPLKRL